MLALMITLPVILLMYWQYYRVIPKKNILLAGVIIFILMAVAYMLLKPVIYQRWQETQTELSLIVEGGGKNTSIGNRLDMWEFAWEEGLQHPLIGAGSEQMMIDKEQWVNERNASRRIIKFGHLHNEFLDAFAKKGIFGLGALLLLFLIPLGFYFYQRPQNAKQFAVKLTAVSHISMYIGFSLTEVTLNVYKLGMVLYILPLCVFFAVYRSLDKC
ncbi:O-antigen ligase family protein [Suttonella sp. R2A3]|uniref:O-antigen ligase family protein n=1 Tax=Suttonella sp. R2A3 TaxID=2908648 RepID=UPI001F400BCC|nr:O-antigen ligase family protein [Suttonella sp. R2A3]UJF23812.1 O-antigen ligase family protein [Suttonella sp. R2A3]